MKALLFLGCTVPVRNLNYELSARKVAAKLDLELVDDPALACCGFPLKGVDQAAALTVAAKALAQAKAHGLPMVCLCSACAAHLAEAEHHLSRDPGAAAEVNERLAAVGLSYRPGVRVTHLVRFLLAELGLEAIQAQMVRDLSQFTFAPHYGCHYLKPSQALDGLDDPEDPHSLAQLIEATGAKALNHPSLKECCGGGVLGVDEELAGRLAGAKLKELNAAAVTALVLVCPFCNVMYEGQQKKIAKSLETKLAVPVIYLTQLMGLGLGLSPDELGFSLNRAKPKELLEALAQ
ncbi:MAG: CoB--CoM heterodisulfide reductase iron-sulfur subunit B family protein [Thermodesulfobacteriota bacterium]